MILRNAEHSLFRVSALAPFIAVPELGRPGNDNPCPEHDAALLRAALRHFAEHGLGAADRAREAAELAHDAGDAGTFQHWAGICAALDRRMAMRLRDRCEDRGDPK